MSTFQNISGVSFGRALTTFRNVASEEHRNRGNRPLSRVVVTGPLPPHAPPPHGQQICIVCHHIGSRGSDHMWRITAAITLPMQDSLQYRCTNLIPDDDGEKVNCYGESSASCTRGEEPVMRRFSSLVQRCTVSGIQQPRGSNTPTKRSADALEKQFSKRDANKFNHIDIMGTHRKV